MSHVCGRQIESREVGYPQKSHATLSTNPIILIQKNHPHDMILGN